MKFKSVFKVMSKRETKFISLLQSDAKRKNERRSSNPFFEVRGKRKTNSKIYICFSMSCEREKWKWNLNFIFPCHRKTVGTKLHAFRGSKSTNDRTYTDISLYQQQKSVHVTVCLVLNFRTRPHSTLVH